MSKSKLTGIAPNEITDTFGSDAFRYYFMRAISFGHDGSFSWEDLHARYHAELANGFGNLASRVLAMNAKYFGSVMPSAVESEISDEDRAIRELAASVTATADAVSYTHLDVYKRQAPGSDGYRRIHGQCGSRGARRGLCGLFHREFGELSGDARADDPCRRFVSRWA